MGLERAETSRQGGTLTGIDCRRVLDAFVDPVVATDATHRVVYLNPAAENLLGWSAAELVGQALTTIIPPRFRSQHREGFKRYLATHTPRLIGRTLDVPALRRDGSEVAIGLNVNALCVDGDDLIVAELRAVANRVDPDRPPKLTRYLRATTRAAAKLGTRLDLEQILETVVDTLVADFDAALARIWLYEPATNTLHLRASAGLSRATTTSSRGRLDVATDPYKVGEVARTREPYFKNGLAGDPQFDQEWVAREQIAAASVFPLLSGDELKGVLAYFSRQPIMDDALEALTAFIAIVVTSLNDVILFAREQAARVEAEDQRQKLQTILNLLPIGLMLAEGPDGRLTLVNPAGQEMLGDSFPNCSLAELEARLPVFSMEGKQYATIERPLWRALHQGERVRERIRYRRPDGQEGILDVSAAPFPGPSTGAVASLRDVTARLRMESELAERAAQLKALLDHLPVGVVYFDNECICRASNGPALRIFGLSRKEITGTSADELFAQAPELHSALSRCVREQTPHAEQSSPWPESPGSGEVCFLDWRFEPLPSDSSESRGALALIVDVTERKRAENDLKLAKEAAEQSDHNKTRFLSAVSHDLRTPVNALNLLAELLSQVVSQRDPPGGELSDIASDIHLAAANLIELINDLLDLARFDSGSIEHEPTDFALEEWLAATLEPLQMTAQAKALTLTWHVDRPGRMLYADRVKLSRVLTNLVGNAVKFTEAGSVTVAAGVNAHGWLSVAVSDTGLGIPEDQRERIFDEFAQLRNPERDRTKGTGLGLAICKRLVEAVGGRLTLTSRVGAGSTFTALFPPDHLMQIAPAPPAVQPQPAEQVAVEAPILIVEDDASSRHALTRLLDQAGYKVEPACDGPAALDALRRVHPSLILLDLMLPGMDGMEVLRQIRAQPEGGVLPVVLLSGDVLGDHLDAVQKLGVADVVAKPVDFQVLLGVIARHLKGGTVNGPGTRTDVQGSATSLDQSQS